MTKCKIVLIANTSNFFSSFMLNHIKQLSTKYNVIICCNGVDKLKKLTPRNVTLIKMNFKRGLKLISDIIAFFIILSFFIKKKPDLSISFTPKIGLMVALASFITKVPNRIHWYTGQIWVKKKGFVKFFYKLIDKLIFFLSHNVLIDSFSQRNFLIKEKIVSIKRSHVLYKGSVGGVNTFKFRFNKKKRLRLRKKLSISQNTFVFLYLGRINQDKGIIELIKAFEKIKKKKNVLLFIVGPVEDKKLIYCFKNKRKVSHFDFSTNPQDWFLLADILCIPSHREGFGTVVIEAASCGTPALCSKIYGLYDSILEHKTGFFHEVNNIDDIKKKMLYAINNKDLIKRYGLSAKKRVLKDFKQNLLSKELLKFIKSNITKNES